MNAKHFVLVGAILFLGRFSMAAEPDGAIIRLTKPVPRGQIGFITINALARFAPLNHRSALTALFYGKHEQAKEELLLILQKEPDAKATYVGLVQVSPDFREQEWARLQPSQSSDRLTRFQRAVLLHYRAMAESPLPAFGVSRAPKEIIKQRRESARVLQQLWDERKEVIVGGVLLEVKDFIDDTEHEAMGLVLLRYLAGEAAWSQYERAKTGGWSSPLPETSRQPVEARRALAAAISDRWSFLRRRYRKPTPSEVKEIAYLDRWRRSVNQGLPRLPMPASSRP